MQDLRWIPACIVVGIVSTGCSASSTTLMPSASSTFVEPISATVSNLPTSAPATAISSPTISPTDLPLLASNEVIFELVDQQAGATNSLAADGDMVYLGVGPRLLVISIADALRPQLVGQSVVLPGLVNAVLVKDGVAYVGAGEWFVALDVAQPTIPTVLGMTELPGIISRIGLGGKTIVAGLRLIRVGEVPPRECGGIATLDLLDGGSPRLLDWVELPYPVEGMALADHNIYAANPYAPSLYLVSASDPASLGAVEAIDDFKTNDGFVPGRCLAVFGERLVAGGDYHVTLWDIGQPLRPQKIWKSGFIAGVVNDFVVSSGRMYIWTGFGDAGVYTTSMVALDIPDDTLQPELRQPVSTNLIRQGEHLLATNKGVEIYSLDGQADPTQIGFYSIPEVQDVAVIGDVGMFISGGSRTIGRQEGSYLNTIDLPSLETRGQYVDQPQCDQCRSTLLNISIAGQTAYLGVWDDGLRVLDLSNPFTPSLKASLDSTNGFAGLWIEQIVVKDGRAYAIALLDQFQLAIFDVTASGGLELVNTVALEGTVQHVAVTERAVYVYAIEYTDQETHLLYRVSIADRLVRVTDRLELSSPVYDLHAVDDTIVIAFATGITIVAETGADSPTVMAELPLAGGAWGVDNVGSVVLVTTAGTVGQGHLLALEFSDPTTPRLVGLYTLPTGRARIDASGNWVLVGNPQMGLEILRIQGLP